MHKYYTGVGARSTPENILVLMERIAAWLQERNWILRSGGAEGADTAFENGAGDLKQIFYANDATPEAMDMAAKFHPAWENCSSYARKLHGRDSFQVLGPDLNNPSKFLICWTPDGVKTHRDRTVKTGGTGTAISIANHWNIKIFNLACDEDRMRIIAKLQEYLA